MSFNEPVSLSIPKTRAFVARVTTEALRRLNFNDRKRSFFRINEYTGSKRVNEYIDARRLDKTAKVVLKDFETLRALRHSGVRKQTDFVFVLWDLTTCYCNYQIDVILAPLPLYIAII